MSFLSKFSLQQPITTATILILASLSTACDSAQVNTREFCIEVENSFKEANEKDPRLHVLSYLFDFLRHRNQGKTTEAMKSLEKGIDKAVLLENQLISSKLITRLADNYLFHKDISAVFEAIRRIKNLNLRQIAIYEILTGHRYREKANKELALKLLLEAEKVLSETQSTYCPTIGNYEEIVKQYVQIGEPREALRVVGLIENKETQKEYLRKIMEPAEMTQDGSLIKDIQASINHINLELLDRRNEELDDIYGKFVEALSESRNEKRVELLRYVLVDYQKENELKRASWIEDRIAMETSSDSGNVDVLMCNLDFRREGVKKEYDKEDRFSEFRRIFHKEKKYKEGLKYANQTKHIDSQASMFSDMLYFCKEDSNRNKK